MDRIDRCIGLLALAACAAPPPARPAGTAPEPAPTAAPAPTVPDDPPEVDVETVPGAVAPLLWVSPEPGVFVGETTISLVSDDPLATIFYTVNGGPPDPATAAVWTGPLTVTSSTAIRAVAVGAVGSSAVYAGAWLRIQPDVDGFSSNLPLAVLWTTEEAPEVKSEVYTPFSLNVFEPAAGGSVSWPGVASLSTRAGLHVRGSSSAGYPKHPYRLETWQADADADRDVVLLGMPAEGDWVLGAPLDFDRAMMRDPLAFALSNAIGRYAPRTRYVELFVAELGESVGLDDYVGVYVATERIERDADRVDVTPLLPTDVALPAVTGGYVFKEDRLGPGEFGFTAGTGGGILDFQQPFAFVDPGEDEVVLEQYFYLRDELDELGEALVAPDFVNPYTGRHYSAIIDVDAFIDHHVINVLAKNPDAFRLSGYFFKDREAPIHAGPVWDFDRTMGCDSDSRAEDPTWWDASNVTFDCTFVFEHGFYGGLFADPAFRDQYWARWRVLLDTTLTVAAIDAVVDGFAAELAEAAPRNYAQWPDYPPRGGDLASEVAILKDWLAARHAWIDGCLDLPDPRTCPGG
jgi:hypothetical protein